VHAYERRRAAAPPLRGQILVENEHPARCTSSKHFGLDMASAKRQFLISS
jgi:hypothetical protein